MIDQQCPLCSQELCRRTKDGSTALHLCALHNKPESLKLLLRCRLDLVNLENSSGLTALEIAQNNGQQLCVELVCVTHTSIHSPHTTLSTRELSDESSQNHNNNSVYADTCFRHDDSHWLGGSSERERMVLLTLPALYQSVTDYDTQTFTSLLITGEIFSSLRHHCRWQSCITS